LSSNDCDDLFFLFGLEGGLRCFNNHTIAPAATSQNAAIHMPNHVPLYHGVESTGSGVGLGVGVTVGVVDSVAVGMNVGVTVVDVGMPVGDAVGGRVCVGVRE
jgi:hypothetical protein